MDKKQIEIDAKTVDATTQVLRRAFNWILKNTQLVVGILVLSLLVLLGIPTYHYFQDRQEELAQEAFFVAEKKYLTAREKWDTAAKDNARTEQAALEKAKSDKAKSPAKEEPKTAMPQASGDVTQDYGESIQALDQVMAEHPGTRAALMAGLMLADLFEQHKKYDEAIDRLGRVRGKSTDSFLAGFVDYKYGNLLAAKGDCTKALNEWDNSLKSSAPESIKDYTRVAMGLCYEKMSDYAGAEKVYQEVASRSPSSEDSEGGPEATFLTSEAKKEAERNLRALKFKQPQGS